MKRIYIEMIAAILVLIWTVGNIFLTRTFVPCFPIIIGFYIQFVGILATIMESEG